MSAKKESLNDILVIFATFLGVIIIIDYLFFNSIWIPDRVGVWLKLTSIFQNINEHFLWMVRLFFCVVISCFVWLSPNFQVGKTMTDKEKALYRYLYVIVIPVFVIGYLNIWIYDLLVYPIFFVATVYISSKAINSFVKVLKEENILGAISNKKSNFSFTLPSIKGSLVIHIPQQNIWVDSSPGGGKTETVIKPIIRQCGVNGIAGLIYDFEGDPFEEGSPILGNVAYTAVMEGKSLNPNLNLNFSFINFSDLSKTVRINPMAKRYNSEQLYIMNMIENLMTNLSVNNGKSDFWEKYGTLYIKGIALNLFKNYPEYATLPHVVSVALNSIDTVLRWIQEDFETSLLLQSIIGAWEKEAHSQLAGAETSGQLPVQVLFNPKIFWVLSVDEFDLDITNPKNPYLLGIGNTKKLEQSLAPVISVIISVIMRQMNTPGKVPSVFCFDEFPTVKVNKVDTFIATARKHKVATILGLQDFTQAEINYGDKQANVLRTSCGNAFYGLTRNLKTAEYVSASLGEIKKENISFTTSAENHSVSDSLNKEKALQVRDIMGQPAGHFTGFIANGEPPFFHVQFDQFQYEVQPIPPFALPNKTGDYDKDMSHLEKLVEDNYNRINTEVVDMLEPYKKENQ